MSMQIIINIIHYIICTEYIQEGEDESICIRFLLLTIKRMVEEKVEMT